MDFAIDPKTIKEIELKPGDFSIEEFVAIARYGAKLSFSEAYRQRVDRTRNLVVKFLEEKRVVYGVTTGFGDNVSKSVSPEDAAKLQENIIRSHAVSVGKPLDPEEVRAVQLIQIINTGRGYSGVSTELLDQIKNLLNAGVVPFAPGEGVAGGLSVEGQTALVLMGEGRAYYQGELMTGAEALAKAGITPYRVKAKEGLSMLNGSTSAAGLAVMAVYDSMLLTKTSEVMSAMSFETNKGTIKALDPRMMSVKRHSEQQESAENILRMLEGSQVAQANINNRIQDAYSLRLAPHMYGGVKRVLKEAALSVWEELNSCSDNPVIFPEGDDGIALMGGNFDRTYLSLHMDAACVAMAHIAKLTERRVDRLTNRHFTDLPPFLVKNPGLNSGYMIVQYTAAGLVSEIRILAQPASIDSIPTSANQEDPITFGYFASRKAYDLARKLEYLLAVELMTQVQAMDLMEGAKFSPATEAVRALVRSQVPPVDDDRHFYPDIEAIKNMIASGEIINCVESKIGKLKF